MPSTTQHPATHAQNTAVMANTPASSAQASLHALWQHVGLPDADLTRVQLTGKAHSHASSFAIGDAAQSAVAAATLGASALAHLRRPHAPRLHVHVDAQHALAETSGHFSLDGVRPNIWSPTSGLYPCGSACGAPGWVRVHANFAHHRDGVLHLLGLPSEHTQADALRQALTHWSAAEFEAQAATRGLVVAAARSRAEWLAHPQHAAVMAQPLIDIAPINGPDALGTTHTATPLPWPELRVGAAPLADLRVLDFTRILAGPVAARTLAANGAEVLMVNGPGLPNIEAIADVSRGKRSALLDVRSSAGQAALQQLLGSAHVFVQGYRPGSLAALGLGPVELARLRPGLVYASLSTYGRTGPWADRRGFDSLVQTVSGINALEAEAFGASQPRALPVQILDYCAGFLLAFGIEAALWRQHTQGGSWHLQVNLARVAEWLIGLGRRELEPAADALATTPATAAPATSTATASEIATATPGLDASAAPPAIGPYLESLSSGFGRLRAVRHSGELVGMPARWPHPSVPPGTDSATWPL